jgi:hypothetical protein
VETIDKQLGCNANDLRRLCEKANHMDAASMLERLENALNSEKGRMEREVRLAVQRCRIDLTNDLTRRVLRKTAESRIDVLDVLAAVNCPAKKRAEMQSQIEQLIQENIFCLSCSVNNRTQLTISPGRRSALLRLVDENEKSFVQKWPHILL